MPLTPMGRKYRLNPYTAEAEIISRTHQLQHPRVRKGAVARPPIHMCKRGPNKGQVVGARA
jgi:hypothetical protein